MIYPERGTLGYFSQLELFQAILDGLAMLDVEVVATLGAHNDPACLGPQRENIHLERWLSLSLLLPLCSMVAHITPLRAPCWRVWQPECRCCFCRVALTSSRTQRQARALGSHGCCCPKRWHLMRLRARSRS